MPKTNIHFDANAVIPDRKIENPCALYFSATGTKDSIRNKLQEMLNEINSSHGKTYQGIISQYGGVTHVITPI